MSTLSVHRSPRGSVRSAGAAYATRLERLLLSAAALLTSAAEAHVRHRASRVIVLSAAAHDDARRDAVAAGHMGLLPR
ncbi:hypothetical protein ACPW96_11725 [Micromonospora sp. DT81.3]|uniref:hypothetical protein n=1 Tax=Micromonospora sp. DT81.3 TaxID=3416523 RepID=UPI003CEDC274